VLGHGVDEDPDAGSAGDVLDSLPNIILTDNAGDAPRKRLVQAELAGDLLRLICVGANRDKNLRQSPAKAVDSGFAVVGKGLGIHHRHAGSLSLSYRTPITESIRMADLTIYREKTHRTRGEIFFVENTKDFLA
jgi:hypothetical protein